MKQAILKDIGVIQVLDVPEPELKKDEALIEVAACGLCGSDVGSYLGKSLDLIPVPRVCGHEFGGTIKKLNGKTKLKVGDKVVVSPIISCGNCYYCKMGRDQLCIAAGKGIQIPNIGQARDGAFAEMIAVPISNLIKIPDDFDMELTGIIEPLAVAYADTKGIKDSNAVIIGAGGLGLIAVKLLKQNNNRVIAVDISNQSLNRAKKAGADYAINIEDKKRVEKIENFLEGGFVDYVLNYHLSNDTMDFAIEVVKKYGEIKNMSTSDTKIETDINATIIKEIKMVGHMAYTMEEFKEAVNIIVDKEIDVKDIISAKFPLEKTKEAFDYKAKENVAKVIIINEHFFKQ